MDDLRGGQPSAPAETTAKISGFWRRLVALWIDMLLLGVVGLAIGTVFFRQVMALGQEGRLIGAAITLAYYGCLNTGWGGGTFGKRIMGLRVIRSDGRTIGLFRSLLRTIVFWTPYYLNGIFFSHVHIPGLPEDPRIDVAAGIADGIIVFGGLVFIAYLYVFNSRTRQSLHDLIAGTFVVRADSVGAPVRVRFWRGHLAIACLATLALVAAPLSVIAYMGTTSLGKAISETSDIQSAVTAYPGADTASVQFNTFTFMTGSATTSRTSLAVNVRMRDLPADVSATQNDVAALVLTKSPSILGAQFLSVGIVTGYDLGIFRWTNTSSWSGTLEQWRQRLAPREPASKLRSA